MTAPIRIAIAGALGRMGQTLADLAEARDDLTVSGLYDRPDVFDARLVTRAQALADADVVIDFTTPEASVALAQEAAASGRPALVIGSTGLSDAQRGLIQIASKTVAIVQTGNFSLGVNMLMGLVARAAKALGPDAYDIEITEAHHHRKVDAPSGTALMLGAAAAEGRGVDLSQVVVRARDGITGPRTPGEIGFSVIRAGGIIGEHAVLFAAEDEILTLSHSARDRSLFARGALEAARWVAGRKCGHFDMQDVLGLKT